MADRLGLLQAGATVITVAGTNGKGSCIRAMELALLSQGKQVAAYTSPHIYQYNERIRLNGVAVSDALLMSAFEAIDTARGDTSLTYFEFGTLAALWIMKVQGSDFWLLEVGLGGRLDAVNVVDAQVAVITSIGLDHCEWLGDTEQKIAYEKAGICRPNTPLVCAVTKSIEAVDAIRERASSLGCPQFWIGETFGFRCRGTGLEVWFTGEAKAAPSTQIFDSVALAPHSLAAALKALSLVGVDVLALPSRVFDKPLPGRLERIKLNGVSAILDVAHNPPALEYLAKWLRSAPTEPCTTGSEVMVILGMMADKDLLACVQALGPVVSGWVLLPLPEVARAATVSQLRAVVECVAPEARVWVADTADHAVTLACEAAGAQGQILVTGSFYTVQAIGAVNVSAKISADKGE